MENLNNVDEQNLHPKPTEDPGAQIETVTPDTEKEGMSNDKNSPSRNTGNQTAANSDKKEDPAPESQENDPENMDTAAKDTKANEDNDDDVRAGVETITP